MKKTPDPPGGKIDHESSYRKTERPGRRERPRFFDKAIPHNFTRDDHREGVKLISKMLAKTGITSATEAQGNPTDLRAYQDARDSGDLLYRAYCFINYRFIDAMIEAGVRTGFGDEWVRLGAMKLVCDGSLPSAPRGCLFLMKPANDFGILVMTEEELYTYGRKAHLAGWQIARTSTATWASIRRCACTSDYSAKIRATIRVFRLEHCTLINDDLIRAHQSVGRPSLRPSRRTSTITAKKCATTARSASITMFALRSFLEPAFAQPRLPTIRRENSSPMMALQSEVTRTDTKGNVWDPPENYRGRSHSRGTINGAYASYEENLKGSIETGKLADLVVLGRDPLKENPSTLVTIPVERTMAGGRWTFES